MSPLDQSTFLRLTLVSVFLLNMVASFIQANFAGLASLLPNQIMHLMVTGQAMSGLFAVAAQILTLAGNWSIVESTFVYFVFADLIILVTLLVYIVTTKTQYFRYHNSQLSLESSFDSNENSFDLSAFKLVFTKVQYFLYLTIIRYHLLNVFIFHRCGLTALR